MRVRLSVFRLSLAAALCLAAPVGAQHGHDHEHAHGGRHGHAHAPPKEPPKDALFGYALTLYPEAQRQAILREAHAALCGCGRGTTVAHCLLNDRFCPFAPRQANAIIERATGAPYPALQLDYSLTDGDVPGVALRALSPAQAKRLQRHLEKTACPCGCMLLACLRHDPHCQAAPILLARVYKNVVKRDLPGATARAMPTEPPPRYDTLPGHDLSTLSEARRAHVLKLANRQACPCGCGMTLAQCRNEDPACELSPKLVNGLIFAAATGEISEDP